jgi:ketosteroid isomerase-like protein
VAEFAYQRNHAVTGEPVSQPAIFVMRVRNGEIVSGAADV